MAVKERNEEVTHSRLIGACPKATLNAATQKPVGKKRVYDILRADCYDQDPADAWTHGPRTSRAALTDDMKSKRVRFADEVLTSGHTREWLFENLVWSDLCNSVLPRTERVATSQALARKRKQGWGSKRSRRFSRNLRGSQEVLKQKGWGSERIWWVPVLARGKLHVEVLAPDFPGEEPAGAPAFLAAVRKGVAVRFQAQSKPTTLFLDRGRAFFNPVSAKITAELAFGAGGHGPRYFLEG